MQTFYAFADGNIKKTGYEEIELAGNTRYFGIADIEKNDELLIKYGLADTIKNSNDYGRSVTFENREEHDIIGLYILNHKILSSHSDRVFIYLNKNLILFICKDAREVSNMLGENIEETLKNIGFDRIITTFFERLTSKDVAFLENIEQEISNLENALITSKKRNCVKDIISLRKRLMVFKRYYEQLLNVTDELQQNENGTLHPASLRYVKIFAGRVERLYHSVLNLRDYVTQVREAYQAEVDISLNNIMKIFTVITAIFLPLTLIVGWYGMNLQMPEFKWSFGYPMVIIISAVVAGLCLYYFKKNKWF